jgi:hypothetical protein
VANSGRVNVLARGWSSRIILESWIFVNKVAAMYPIILDFQEEQMHEFDDFQVSFIRKHLMILGNTLLFLLHLTVMFWF